MIIIKLDRKNKEPLFKQVVNNIIEKIDNCTLTAGEKLPSSRKLAEILGVNRTTIYRAYRELWALGYIQSTSGSYSYVRDKKICRSEESMEKKSSINWQKIINPNTEKVYDNYKNIFFPFSHSADNFDDDFTDFAQLHPDRRLYPAEDFRKSFNKTLSENGSRLFDYCQNEGFLPLRKFIASRMQLHGVLTSAKEILITNGAQNALDLLLKLFAKKGTRVFIESPTYGMIINALRFYEYEVVPIPMKETGADLEILEKEISKGSPSFFYTMTNCQNPTGISTSQEHREKLLEICEKYKIPVIEDAFEEELKYSGKIAMPIKSMDVNNQVIYIGSFSKVLFPGIRLGWISAPAECINRLTALKRVSDLNSPLPLQAVIEHYCRNGLYDLHIKKINKIYKKRMQLTLDLLQRIKNPNVKWLVPSGGYTVWLTLENLPFSYEKLNEAFISFKIKIALGRDFFTHPVEKRQFRISISRLNEEEISTGMERLEKAVNYLYSLQPEE